MKRVAFSISGNFSGEMEIYNLMGELISGKQHVDAGQKFSAPEVNGIYFIRLQDDEKTFIRKLIVN